MITIILKKIYTLINYGYSEKFNILVTWNYVKYSWWITFLHYFGSERSCSGVYFIIDGLVSAGMG